MDQKRPVHVQLVCPTYTKSSIGCQLLEIGRFHMKVSLSGFLQKKQLSVVEFAFLMIAISFRPTQLVLVVKSPPASTGDVRDAGLTPGLERSPGGRYGSPLQCFCLENPMDRGAWWAVVHRVPKGWT